MQNPHAQNKNKIKKVKMKKEVLISIKGEQDFENMDKDSSELVTRGTLYEKGNAIYIVYEESELTGMPDTRTTIRVRSDSINVLRTGKFPSNMLFEEKKQHISLYNTPYGPLTLTVNTDKIESNLTMEKGGDLSVYYSLGLDHNYIGKNQLKINVKEYNAEEI